MYRIQLEFSGFKKILVTSWIVSLSLQEILTWHQDRSVSKGLTRRWENYRNCNLAALRPSIRVWPALIRWHTRSLAHRWRAGEASSSLQHPLELLSFSSTFLRTFAQQLIKKPQDVWTLASKHVRVHQVSLLYTLLWSWRFFQEELWTGEMEADTGKDGNQRGDYCLVLIKFLRRLVKKKRIFHGQADRKRWLPPPLYGQLFVIFLCFFFTSP